MAAAPLSLKQELKQLTADKAIFLTLVVSALGYFVDIFDLLLFSIVRVQSLKDLGVSGDALLEQGVFLINVQMAGLLIGGIFWGVLGDKIGRIGVLFASITLYSLANIANGFITNIEQYAFLRFIGGLGLAGELGLCITLVSEILPKGIRGWGTAFVAGIGVTGAAFATLVAEMTDWRTAYIVGGAMGLMLLALRLRLHESDIFTRTKKKSVRRGSLMTLFGTPALLKKYIQVVLVGAPIWAAVGIFITFTPEFAKDFGMTAAPSAGKAVLFSYLGFAVGDLLSGALSQLWRSRRKAIGAFLLFLISTTMIFIFMPHDSLPVYYGLCFLLGVGGGYWAMFVQVGAEQFGTNIRATAATSIPNVVRGLVIPMTASFHALIPSLGVAHAGLAVMGCTVIIAFISLYFMRETFHADLDYLEG
jgi:MFS family permease